MIVISDSSPLNLLVRIGHVDVLPQLFRHVLIPPAVAVELSHERTPRDVREFVAAAPAWLEVRAPSRLDPTLRFEDRGELEAISLALEIKADLLLVDDRKARRAARERGIVTTGAIGALELAASRGLLALPDAFEKVRATNFNISENILGAAIARDMARRNKPL